MSVRCPQRPRPIFDVDHFSLQRSASNFAWDTSRIRALWKLDHERAGDEGRHPRERTDGRENHDLPRLRRGRGKGNETMPRLPRAADVRAIGVDEPDVWREVPGSAARVGDNGGM